MPKAPASVSDRLDKLEKRIDSMEKRLTPSARQFAQICGKTSIEARRIETLYYAGVAIA